MHAQSWSWSLPSLPWSDHVRVYKQWDIEDLNSVASVHNSVETSGEGDRGRHIEPLVCGLVEKNTQSRNIPFIIMEEYKEKDLFSDEIGKIHLTVTISYESGIAWHFCNKELQIFFVFLWTQ